MGSASSAVMAFFYMILAILYVSLCLLLILVSCVSSSISFRFSFRIARRPSSFCTQCNSKTKLALHTSNRLLEGLSSRNLRCSTIHVAPTALLCSISCWGRRNPYIAPRGWSRMYKLQCQGVLVAARQGKVRPEPFTTRGVLLIEVGRGELL